MQHVGTLLEYKITDQRSLAINQLGTYAAMRGCKICQPQFGAVALRRAQVGLAFRKWHLARGEAARGEASDREIRRLRDRIRDLRNALTQAGGNLSAQAGPSRGALGWTSASSR